MTHQKPDAMPAARSRLKLALAVLGLTVASSLHAADLPELKVGIDPAFEPYGIKRPDGTLSGFDVDYAHAICAEIKMKCVHVEQAWAGVIPALMAKKFDVMPNIRRAKVTESMGEVVLELEGTDARLEESIAYLRERGVKVDPVEGEDA